MNTRNPPKGPWPIGLRENLLGTKLEVSLVEDRDGTLWSNHDWPSPEAEHAAMLFRGGGVSQIAHALTVEAVRREAYLVLLTKMSLDSDLVRVITTGSDKERELALGDLTNAVQETMSRVISKMAPSAVQEVIDMVAGNG